jgi:hypothetical protein
MQDPTRQTQKRVILWNRLVFMYVYCSRTYRSQHFNRVLSTNRKDTSQLVLKGLLAHGRTTPLIVSNVSPNTLADDMLLMYSFKATDLDMIAERE